MFSFIKCNKINYIDIDANKVVEVLTIIIYEKYVFLVK